jgi:hypothetical protein
MHRDDVHVTGGHRRQRSAVSLLTGGREGLFGGSHALFILLLLTCSPGGEVAHPAPTRDPGRVMAGLGALGRGVGGAKPYATEHDEQRDSSDARTWVDKNACVEAECQDADAIQRGWVAGRGTCAGLRTRGRPISARRGMFCQGCDEDLGGGGCCTSTEVRICTINSCRIRARLSCTACDVP